MVEGVATNTLVGKLPEPTLHQVQPGTESGGKVQLQPGMLLEPGSHPGMLVGAVIVHGQMEIEPRWGLSIDLLQETAKLLMSMTRQTVPDQLAAQHVEGCKQSSGTIACVVCVKVPQRPFLRGRPVWVWSRAWI